VGHDQDNFFMTRTAAASTYPTKAIVLRVRPLGEKDRVLTLLTPDHGKISAAARGARTPKSKLAAVSQPFIQARFLMAHGRSLDVVTQAEIEAPHAAISADLLKTAWASYLCELCDAVPEAMPEAELYELLALALAGLDEAPNTTRTVELVGRWFEARFLRLLGYPPTLGRCVACGQKLTAPVGDEQIKVYYSPSLGGTLCPSCSSRDLNKLTLRVQALRALRQLERAAAPLQSDDIALTTAAARDLRDCLRQSLLLHLDIRLRSLAFLDDLLATMPPA
jgi:DNA repair protein RecO (recombination protein O)